MVLDKPMDNINSDGTGGQVTHPALGGDGLFRTGLKPWQKLKPSIEILCNNQASSGFCLLVCGMLNWLRINFKHCFVFPFHLFVLYGSSESHILALGLPNNLCICWRMW